MESRIFVQTARQNGRTQVEDMYFTALYKIMRPLYNGGHTDLILMAASAGLLAGDSINAQYTFGDESNVSIRTQGFEKVSTPETDRRAGRLLSRLERTRVCAFCRSRSFRLRVVIIAAA